MQIVVFLAKYGYICNHINKGALGKRVIEIKSKSGTVYLYEDESYWDKEKGYSTHKRTCIVKKGPDGKPIYNKFHVNRATMQALRVEVKKSNDVSNTTFVGVLPNIVTIICRFMASGYGFSANIQRVIVIYFADIQIII